MILISPLFEKFMGNTQTFQIKSRYFINILKFCHCKYILLVLFDFSIVISSLIFMLPYCVVPENIHTPPTEGFLA